MSFTKAYGKYFDGHTSKPYDVELEIWPEKKISFFYPIPRALKFRWWILVENSSYFVIPSRYLYFLIGIF